MIIIHKHGRFESLPRQDFPTTQTLHSKPSISAMLTSLLSLEGFMIFKNKIPAQVLDKNLSPSFLKSLKWLS
jgi:hypothetical protein